MKWKFKKFRRRRRNYGGLPAWEYYQLYGCSSAEKFDCRRRSSWWRRRCSIVLQKKIETSSWSASGLSIDRRFLAWESLRKNIRRGRVPTTPFYRPCVSMVLVIIFFSRNHGLSPLLNNSTIQYTLCITLILFYFYTSIKFFERSPIKLFKSFSRV